MKAQHLIVGIILLAAATSAVLRELHRRDRAAHLVIHLSDRPVPQEVPR